MVKKVVTKTITKKIEKGDEPKKSPSKERKTVKKRMTAREREELLIENFVGLQHAMTNLSIKFGALSDNISELLRILETAARNFSQGGNVDNNDMLRKIDSLLNQNKTIAKGLVLMESKLRGRSEEPSPQPTFTRRPKPLPSL